jgi:hypothetical protein
VKGAIAELMQMLKGASEVEHLACACRPAFSHCGTWRGPERSTELVRDYSSRYDEVCQDCLKVWQGHGCLYCGECKPSGICRLCQQAPTD